MIEIFVWFEFLLSSRYLVGGMFAASSTPEVGEDWETIHHLSNLTVDQASWARCLLKFPIFSDSSQSWLSLIIIFNNLTNHSSEICHMTTIWPIKTQCVGPNLWPTSFHIWFPWHDDMRVWILCFHLLPINSTIIINQVIVDNIVIDQSSSVLTGNK